MLQSNLAFIKYLKLSAFALILFLQNSALAQKTAIYEDESRIYQRAIELFDKEKYAAAQKHFNMFADKSKDEVYVVNAKYYAATCAMELANNDAPKLLSSIIKNYPQYDKAVLAKYQLARHYYRNKDYKKDVPIGI